MKFFSKETCHKLLEIGCVSGSDYFYTNDKENTNRFEEPLSKLFIAHYLYSNRNIDEEKSSFTQAFTIADFLSSKPYAIENCKKICPYSIPDKYEYKITEGQRKCWDGDPDLSLEGWEEYKEWERFQFHEERYWRKEIIPPLPPYQRIDFFRLRLLDAEDQEKFIREAINGK